MQAFRVGHASHADWASALALAAAQIDSGWADAGAPSDPDAAAPAEPPTLGFVYLTDHFAAHAEALLAQLQLRWPGVSWVGSVGVGVSASGVEYFDQPALVLMLAAMPVEHFELFSGAPKFQRIVPFSALVHADPGTADIDELVTEMSERVESRYLFGGLSASRGRNLHLADGVLEGGLSGVAFSQEVALVSRVTQGCQPVGATRRIGSAERNLVLTLDGVPALTCLLSDLGLTDLTDIDTVLPRLRDTLVGITEEHRSALGRAGQFGADTLVRHLVGLDPGRQGVAVGESVHAGMRLAFCQRDAEAARRDLVRVCSEIREELSALSETATTGDGESPAAPREILGAIYVSCSGRGGPFFGGPSAELKIVQHALGDVPLVGYFAGGEIARHHLYGYTGVLTVFAGAD